MLLANKKYIIVVYDDFIYRNKFILLFYLVDETNIWVSYKYFRKTSHIKFVFFIFFSND